MLFCLKRNFFLAPGTESAKNCEESTQTFSSILLVPGAD